MLARAAARFREAFPAVEFRIIATTSAEGLRRLAGGEGELHCGGIDAGEALPEFLRRERFLDMTAGIVAWRDHPLFAGTVAPENLARYPWIDYDWPAPASLVDTRPSLAAILAELCGNRARTPRDGAAPRRRWPHRAGTRPLARLALDRTASAPARRTHPAGAGRDRPLPPPHRLRRKALCRGPAALPGFRAGRAGRSPRAARPTGRAGPEW